MSLQGACVLVGFSFSFPLFSGTNIPCPEPPSGEERFSIDPKQLMPISGIPGWLEFVCRSLQCAAGGVGIRVILEVCLCKAVSLWIPSVDWQHLSLVKFSTGCRSCVHSLGWMICNQVAPLVLALFEREEIGVSTPCSWSVVFPKHISYIFVL